MVQCPYAPIRWLSPSLLQSLLIRQAGRVFSVWSLHIQVHPVLDNSHQGRPCIEIDLPWLLLLLELEFIEQWILANSISAMNAILGDLQRKIGGICICNVENNVFHPSHLIGQW